MRGHLCPNVALDGPMQVLADGANCISPGLRKNWQPAVLLEKQVAFTGIPYDDLPQTGRRTAEPQCLVHRYSLTFSRPFL